MKRTIPFRNEPKNPQNPLFFNLIKKNLDKSYSWQIHHIKTLRTSGRGGKGHFVGGAPHGWNRKGRW
ncbi:MAG: hypothetical protein GXO77_00060 [Calditrichaeota bacterium]|nr:hypothetical protein [Calditrichota bacterium]